MAPKVISRIWVMAH